MTAIWTVVREDKLDILWHGTARLLAALRRREKYVEVADFIEAKMARDDRITKSAFIRALFDYFKDQRVIEALDDAHRCNREDATKRRKAGRASKRIARPKKR